MAFTIERTVSSKKHGIEKHPYRLSWPNDGSHNPTVRELATYFGANAERDHDGNVVLTFPKDADALNVLSLSFELHVTKADTAARNAAIRGTETASESVDPFSDL